MQVQARFIGKDGSLGYKHGQYYRLEIQGNAIIKPRPCPYASVEAFLRNWETTLTARGESDQERSSDSGGEDT